MGTRKRNSDPAFVLILFWLAWGIAMILLLTQPAASAERTHPPSSTIDAQIHEFAALGGLRCTNA